MEMALSALVVVSSGLIFIGILSLIEKRKNKIKTV